MSSNAGDYPALVQSALNQLFWVSLVKCDLSFACIPLKKPIGTIAKHYTKWYDFAYILKREGLKNQGVKNMDGVKSGKI